MDAIVKKTGEKVEVKEKTIQMDEMMSYFVYENEKTHEQYKYSDLKFIKK